MLHIHRCNAETSAGGLHCGSVSPYRLTSANNALEKT